MTSTPRLGLEQMGPGTTDHDTIYTAGAANRLDALVMPAVKNRDLTAPPGGEVNGDRWLVGAGATGAWAGHDDEIAHYWDGWIFTVPADGFRLFVEDERAVLAWDPAYTTNGGWRVIEATATIADDAAASWLGAGDFGIATVASDDVDGVGIVWFETTGPATLKLAGAVNTEVATGALGGTTGNDAKLTISAHTDGKVYVENRLGAPVDVRIAFA